MRTNNKDKAPPIEQQLSTTKERLDGMQKQLDDVGGLTGRMGDQTGYIGDFIACIGNVEQLLQKLVGALEGSTAWFRHAHNIGMREM